MTKALGPKYGLADGPNTFNVFAWFKEGNQARLLAYILSLTTITHIYYVWDLEAGKVVGVFHAGDENPGLS